MSNFATESFQNSFTQLPVGSLAWLTILIILIHSINIELWYVVDEQKLNVHQLIKRENKQQL